MKSNKKSSGSSIVMTGTRPRYGSKKFRDQSRKRKQRTEVMVKETSNESLNQYQPYQPDLRVSFEPEQKKSILLNSVTTMKESFGIGFTPLLNTEDPYKNQTDVKKEVKMFEGSDIAEENAISIND